MRRYLCFGSLVLEPGSSGEANAFTVSDLPIAGVAHVEYESRPKLSRLVLSGVQLINSHWLQVTFLNGSKRRARVSAFAIVEVPG